MAAHPEISRDIQPFMFMYPDRRPTDVFTAWGGQINLSAFLTQGLKGLAAPTKGNFGDFLKEIVPLGDADYAGGWYITDPQAEKMLTVFNSYPGVTEGYSFLRLVSEKPNTPFEPASAALVNGYNCGDFVYYALTTAGILTRETVERLKIRLWYPTSYLSRPLPLKGVGAQGADWLRSHPEAQQISTKAMLGFAWSSLLLSHSGMEFFDKKEIARQITDGGYELNYARVWDHKHAIDWLKATGDFRSKGILTELYPAVSKGTDITSPESTLTPSPRNTYMLSSIYRRMMKRGNLMMQRKLKNADLSGHEGSLFRKLYNDLKSRAEGDPRIEKELP